MERYIAMLSARYQSYGVSKLTLKAMFHLAVSQGLDVKTAYCVIKTGLSQKYGTTEIYSLRDVSSMTGADSAALVMERYRNLFEILGLTGDT